MVSNKAPIRIEIGLRTNDPAEVKFKFQRAKYFSLNVPIVLLEKYIKSVTLSVVMFSSTRPLDNGTVIKNRRRAHA
jgi:hypothetical protein